MTSAHKYPPLVLTAFCLLLFPISAPAQVAEKTTQEQVVALNVIVMDEYGHPVNDVRSEEFRVTEDGVPQMISFVSKEEYPLSYGLIVDCSSSLRGRLAEVIEAGKTIINSNKPGDETFLIRFISNDKIVKVRDFTSGQSRLLSDLDNFYVEGGQTAIIDAVYTSVDYLTKYGREEKGYHHSALILITDGVELSSQHTRAELAKRLHKEDVQIFVIGLVKDTTERERKKAVDLLNFLAQETGGRAYYPNSPQELRGISQAITREIRTQYLIGYSPKGGVQYNTFHRVQVTVAETPGKKRTAITRVGYVATAGP
ncbi:MAG: VWA domain-containing protein [Acidobacteriota bacterium]|nr:VWA domain-containing protein [Acidobacteriota bacterium]